MKKYSLLSFLIITLISMELLSQEPQKEVELNDLMQLSIEELLDLDVNVQVVSASGDNIFSSPSTVSIINKNTIRDFNFQTISEAIQYVSGVNVYRTYLKKNIPTTRGLLSDHYANKILILINGVPTFNAITGEGVLDRISIQSVERIEILKGPASVLYGTNAFSGAINIVLKSESNMIAEAYSGFGYKQFLTSGMQANIPQKNMKIYVSGNSYSNHPDHTEFTDENNESGYIDDLNRNRNFTIIITSKKHSLLSSGYGNQEGYLGVTPEYNAGAGIPHRLSGSLTNYSYKNSIGKKFDFTVKANYDWNKRTISRSRGDSINSDINGIRIYGSINGIYKFNKKISLDFGNLADYRYSLEYSNFITQNLKIISDNNLKNKHIFEQSYFTQFNLNTGRILSTAGLRYTQNELFGGNFSPRLSMVFQINKNNAIKAIYGESFRAPSLFELYFLNPDSTIFGNKNLKPEKIHSIELAYLKQINFFFIQLLGYHSIQKNIIKRTTDDVILNNRLFSDKNVYNNVGEFMAYGLETEIRYHNPNYFQTFINYTFCSGNKGDTIGDNNIYNFKYIPEHQYNIGIQKIFGKFISVSATLKGWSQVEGSLDKIKPQHSLNLSIGYNTQIKGFEFNHSICATNLLNKTIEIPEYIRGNINSVPLYNGISLIYTIKLFVL